MSVVINTNLSSVMVQRNLNKTTNDMNTYMKRLSTGLRINSSADDAAGLALSEKIKSHVDSSDVAKNNAQTGINMLQVAESDLNAIHENLQRMRDLAVQAANGVYSTSERQALSREVVERLEEIDRISNSSAFSDLKLLDGTLYSQPNGVLLQIGTSYETSTNTIDIAEAFQCASTSAGALALDTLTITSVNGARDAMESLDSAIETISDRRSVIGATSNRLESTVQRIDVRKENLLSSYSVIRDADIAVEAANLTRVQILQQASASLLQQANQSTSIALQLMQ